MSKFEDSRALRYTSTKYYDHSEGLSCVFRQPNASHSHCRFLHGYSLSFKFVFEASELDDKNWVVDFGGLKELKKWLHDTFDHKVVIDINDPYKEDIIALQNIGIAEVVELDGVGCEKFAEHAFKFANTLVRKMSGGRCWVESCEVKEHGANGAIYSI